MNGFLWTSGHVGWGLFDLIVFTGLWVLVGDWLWRVTSMKFARLAMGIGVGWAAGVALILAAFGIAIR